MKSQDTMNLCRFEVNKSNFFTLVIEEETKIYVEIKIAETNDWNKKKQSKVNVNAPRRNARPLSWLRKPATEC